MVNNNHTNMYMKFLLVFWKRNKHHNNKTQKDIKRNQVKP